jgi:hypothetical protein
MLRHPAVRSLTLAALALAAGAGPAAAQRLLARADSLYRGGRVTAAESLYYAAVRREPRDPAARLALGRYLAARGALKVGAVLMEEARFFGADPALVARELAPVYARIGDYRALATLPASPLSPAERARAEWMRANGPLVAGPDSVVVPYAPAPRVVLGTVTLVIGGERVTASVDPTAQGLTLDPSWMARGETRLFPADGREPHSTVGITRAVRVGALTLGNVPTRFASQGTRDRARIGLDLLGGLAPTFDERARRLTLRRGGRAAAATSSDARATLPTLALPSGLLVVSGGTAMPVASERGRAAIRAAAQGGRFTVDGRRGEIVVER